MSEITLTEENFEQEVMMADRPVLIDFWAAWCAPCRMLAPVIAELAKDYAGKATIGKVNVDEQPALAAMFHVASIPAVVVIRNGRSVRTAIGVKPKKQLEEMLERADDGKKSDNQHGFYNKNGWIFEM